MDQSIKIYGAFTKRELEWAGMRMKISYLLQHKDLESESAGFN